MLLHKSVVHDSRVRREAGALAAAGHEVTVIELDREAGGELDGFRRLSAMPPAWTRRVLPFQLYRVAFLYRFVRAIKAVRPAVVHAHDAAMLLPGLAGSRLAGAQLVYDSHELATGVPYRNGSWALFVAAVERVIVPRCARVITVSDGIADRIRQRYRLRRRPAVVRNVTDLTPPPAPTGALRSHLGIGTGEPLILHQGAPAPGRGGEVLIRAMADVPGAHLAFLGSSPFPGFEAGLRELAAATGVEARVHFIPSVPLGELLSWTADADVGVSLLQDTCENHRLALPNKLFEYLAARVPVVVSDLPEIARLVRAYGVGWVAPPDRPEDVAETLRTALEAKGSPDLRARLEAAAAELHWRVERERLLRLYDDLLPGGPRRALVLVRNTVTHDARVAREAETLSLAGWEPLVVGVTSTTVAERRARLGSAPLLRLTPRSPLARARARLRSAPAAAQGAPSARPATAEPQRRGGAVRALHRTLTAADWYRQGIGAVRALRPDLIHCNDWNTMWIGVAAKAVWRTPVVYDCHELWPDRNGRPEPRGWLIAAEALFTRVADEVITTSPGYAGVLERRYRLRPPTVVRNTPRASVPAPPRSRREFAYVGGLLRGRGLEQAIQALPRLPEAELVLIGPSSDAYRAELERLAAELGVEGRVRLRGAVPPDAVVTAVAGAAAGICLIQPICLSYELTLPNKLFEYAAADLPILASDLPVIADYVRTWDAGEIVPPTDVDAIARGMERMLDPERAERYRRGARSLARHATWERERAILTDVYARAGA